MAPIFFTNKISMQPMRSGIIMECEEVDMARTQEGESMSVVGFRVHKGTCLRCRVNRAPFEQITKPMQRAQPTFFFFLPFFLLIVCQAENLLL